MAAALVVLAVGAGCSAVTELLQLSSRIERAGYTGVEVFHNFGSGSSSEVTVDASVGRGEPPPAGQQEIAEIVWTTYPRRFDLLTVTLGGDLASFERSELTALFGPRDPSLDEREFSDDVTSGIRTASIVFGLFALVAVVVVVVLVRRSRRRRAQQWPGMPPSAPAGYATYGRWARPAGRPPVPSPAALRHAATADPPRATRSRPARGRHRHQAACPPPRAHRRRPSHRAARRTAAARVPTAGQGLAATAVGRPARLRVRRGASSLGTSARNARARWLMACFSSSAISAKVRPSPSSGDDDRVVAEAARAPRGVGARRPRRCPRRRPRCRRAGATAAAHRTRQVRVRTPADAGRARAGRCGDPVALARSSGPSGRPARRRGRRPRCRSRRPRAASPVRVAQGAAP